MYLNKYYKLAKDILFPICRSITGNGIKKTLKIIKSQLPKLKIYQVKSGTKVFDWRVPPEWNVKDAYILDKNNKKIIDFKNNNLHLVGYSRPTKSLILKNTLIKNFYFLTNQPNAIPYVTSYYKKIWGFCISYNQFKKLKKKYKDKDKFKVIINSNFNKNGNLNFGEYFIKGKSRKEILISTYICHPSMANNELSGPIVSMALINFFTKKNLQKSLRFIFVPETIGSIAFLHKNLLKLKKNVIGGFNLTCIGDEKNHSCMLSKGENSPSDEAVLDAYKKLKIKKYKIYSFLKRGSDERQYNSPGIDLGITSIFRTKYGEFPEYHTSLDNFDLVTLKGIQGGYNIAKTAINILQKKIIPENKVLCETNLGKRKLYPTLSKKNSNFHTKKYVDFLQYCDGKNTLRKISQKILCSENETLKLYKIFKKKKIIV